MSLVAVSACGTGSSQPTAPSGQPSGSGNSPTAGYALPGRSHHPLTVPWVSSLSPGAPGGGTPPPSSGSTSPPLPGSASPSSENSLSSSGSSSLSAETGVLSLTESNSDWYTALAYRHCDSVVAPSDASPSLNTLVRGVQAACIAATGAGPSATEDWNIATQAYDELAGMQMPCEQGAALALLGRLVQAHREDPEALISIVLPAPEQQTECS
jgi:hypothetical protein